MAATVYLIPVFLYDDETALQCLPAYLTDVIKNCSVFYVENERTARRFLKKIFKEINIDAYEWHAINKPEDEVLSNFRKDISEQKTIGIMSEAGCP